MAVTKRPLALTVTLTLGLLFGSQTDRQLSLSSKSSSRGISSGTGYGKKSAESAVSCLPGPQTGLTSTLVHDEIKKF